MSEHDSTPIFLKRLESLHRSFEQMHRDLPTVNVYFLWPHADQWKFESSDANLVLGAMNVKSPDCERTGHGSGDGHCYLDWPPHDPNKPFRSYADFDSLNDFTDILDHYPPFKQRPEWAASLSCIPFDWDSLALTAACAGLEHPEMLIRVHKQIITAEPFQRDHLPHLRFCNINSDFHPDHPLLWCTECTDETNHCLDFLCTTPVTVVTVRHIFDAAVKLVEATIHRLNARNRPTPGNN